VTAGLPPYRICLVCAGNICRSPMAEVVLRERLDAAGLTDRVTVDSAGTGDWHVGAGADRRALAALRARGYDGTAHRARQWDPGWATGRDLVLALDETNLAALRRSTGGQVPVRLLREWDATAQHDLGVPDPFYGDDAGFGEVLDIVERCADGLVADLRQRLG
jgi:protein-tyrosine phosphatase